MGDSRYKKLNRRKKNRDKSGQLRANFIRGESLVMLDGCAGLVERTEFTPEILSLIGREQSHQEILRLMEGYERGQISYQYLLDRYGHNEPRE